MAKTYSTVPDKAAGDVFTEAMWDTYVKDNGNNLIVKPTCRIYHNTTQSATTGVDLTLAFNSERHDTDTMHDTVTNNSRITIQTAGVYFVFCSAVIAANATGYRVLYAMLNGTTRLTQVMHPSATASADSALNLGFIYEFAAADYVQFLVLQNSGGALNVQGASAYTPEAGAIWLSKTS